MIFERFYNYPVFKIKNNIRYLTSSVFTEKKTVFQYFQGMPHFVWNWSFFTSSSSSLSLAKSLFSSFLSMADTSSRINSLVRNGAMVITWSSTSAISWTVMLSGRTDQSFVWSSFKLSFNSLNGSSTSFTLFIWSFSEILVFQKQSMTVSLLKSFHPETSKCIAFSNEIMGVGLSWLRWVRMTLTIRFLQWAFKGLVTPSSIVWATVFCSEGGKSIKH